MKGFKDFILRGNVVDLAVAVVIGAAFGAVVTALVTNVFNPIIGALFKADSLDNAMDVTIGDATMKFGVLIGAIINFLIVAAVIYFCFVLPIQKLRERTERMRKNGEVSEDEVAPTSEELLTDIRNLLAAQVPAGGTHATVSPAAAEIDGKHAL